MTSSVIVGHAAPACTLPTIRTSAFHSRRFTVRIIRSYSGRFVGSAEEVRQSVSEISQARTAARCVLSDRARLRLLR